jgi:hypothetical protein
MFKKNKMKFKLVTDKGRVRNCRICVFKEAKNTVVRHRNGKFELVNLTLIQRIKEFLS